MLSQGLDLSQKQTLRLNAQLIQSFELMALPLDELQAKIDDALLSNPTLQATGGNAPASWEERTEGQRRAEERKDDYSDSSAYGSDLSDSHQAWLEGAIATRETLQDHLLWQLGCTSCPPDTAKAAEAIISSLGPDGFLTRPLEEVVPRSLQPYTQEALDLIHGFDPVGIAVPSWRESLIVQAQALGLEGKDLETFKSLCMDHLEEMKAGKTAQVAKALKTDSEDLDDLWDVLKSLNPFPASSWSSGEERYIVPDVSIKVEDGHLVVRLNDSTLPTLSLDAGYQEMASTLSKGTRKDEKEAARYLKKQLGDGESLIRQLELRRNTLERVSSVLAVRQKAFFLFGPGNLKPLTLHDVAVELDLSDATVSRITSAKHVDTDWGIIPMKSLFSSALKTSDGTGEVSKEAVKEMVRRIIEEAPGTKLSDQKISDMLGQRGVSCARRTVAKYRKELGMDSSYHRD